MSSSSTVLACALGQLESLPQTTTQLMQLAPGETLESGTLRAEKIHTGESCTVEGSTSSPTPTSGLPWHHLEDDSMGSWPIRCLGSVRRTAAAMAAAGPPLAECFDIRTGVMGFNYHAALDALRELNPDELPGTEKKHESKHETKIGRGRRAVSPGLVGALRCHWGETEVKLGGERRRYPVLAEQPDRVSDETWAWFARPKVLIPGVAGELRAFFDERGEYAPLVAVHGVSGTETGGVRIAGDVGLGLAVFLCSAPVRWWFRARWEGARIPRGSRRFGVGMLASIPLPRGGEELAELAGFGPGELDEASKLVARMFGIELKDLCEI